MSSPRQDESRVSFRDVPEFAAVNEGLILVGRLAYLRIREKWQDELGRCEVCSAKVGSRGTRRDGVGRVLRLRLRELREHSKIFASSVICPEYKEFNRQLLRDDLHDWSRTWWPSFRDRVEPEMRELAGRLGVEVPSLRQMVKDAAFTQ